MPSSVPRIGRSLDLAALALFLVGAGVYARSWWGLRNMESFQRADPRDIFAASREAERLSELSGVGVGIMAAAVLIGIIAFVVARRVKKAAAADVTATGAATGPGSSGDASLPGGGSGGADEGGSERVV